MALNDQPREAKAYDGSRWVCAECASNNMLDSNFCFHCGVERPFQLYMDPKQGKPTRMAVHPVPQAPAPIQKKTDLCAVLSAGCGLLGFWAFGGCVFGPLALLLAAVSLARIQDNPHLTGRGQAYMGLILGGVSTYFAASSIQAAIEALQKL